MEVGLKVHLPPLSRHDLFSCMAAFTFVNIYIFSYGSVEQYKIDLINSPCEIIFLKDLKVP